MADQVSPGQAPLALILWDIDGTLLEVTGATQDAYAEAFLAATGQPLGRPWRFDGRTELAAITEVLAEHDLAEHDLTEHHLCDHNQAGSGDLRTAFLASLTDEFRRRSDSFAADGRVLPGAREALAAVAALPGACQTVLTGNLRAVAAIKLAAFGLDRYLDLAIGAYGEDAMERTDLPAYALARASARLRRPVRGGDTVIVGDTVRDVGTARAAGARCIAVATGTTSEAELRAAGAAVVLPDLSDTAAVLAAIAKAG